MSEKNRGSAQGLSKLAQRLSKIAQGLSIF